MKTKFCVIGGSGFIGTRLLNLFSDNNYQCVNIDKKLSDQYNKISLKCDIREDNKLKKVFKYCDTVILLAAEHRDDVSPVSLYYDVNVQGTKNVLDAMDLHGINNIIFTSSVAIYGLNKQNPEESHPADPFNHYGKSKWQAEEILRKWFNEKPKVRNLTIIRPTVVFGEENRGNVYNLLSQIASGRFMMVGNGLNKKSMAYVGNVASFIDFCANNMKGNQVYNYIDKPDMNMNELVNQVEKSLNKKVPAIRLPLWIGMLGGYAFDSLSKLSGRKFSISSVRVKKFCATTQFDAKKVYSSGFDAPFTLENGLDRTIKKEFLDKN